MNGEVPGMYWFVFWVCFVMLGWVGMYVGARAAHRSKMRALDILQMYAEKGAEPPPTLAAMLDQSMPDQAAMPPRRKRNKTKARYLESFSFSLFMAGGAAAIAWWRFQANTEPGWGFYAAVVAAVAFGCGALAALISALSTPNT